jgi:hypothetical protein
MTFFGVLGILVGVLIAMVILNGKGQATWTALGNAWNAAFGST